MGWPFNGTRRWYLLHRRENPDGGDYVTTTIRTQAEQHRLVFAHGVSVIAAPHFGAELLERSPTYTRTVLGGLLKLGPDLSLYLGYSQPALFDVPLIATGQEDLYATLTPSADLTERQLREILYDHLITRRLANEDYEALPDEALSALAEYNERYRGHTLGIGRIDPLTGVWNPLLPDSSGTRLYG